MNDKVEEIYTQMFAPHPIPQSVIDLYDRVVFLGNRIDLPNVSYGGLSIIAALATKDAKSSISKPIVPEEVDMSETLPAQKDVAIMGTGPEASVEPLTPPTPPDTASPDEHGPTGPMDAPTPLGPQKGMSVKRLMQLTKGELKAHAREFYDYKPPNSHGKRQIANAIKAMKPIRAGAVANKPNGA